MRVNRRDLLGVAAGLAAISGCESSTIGIDGSNQPDILDAFYYGYPLFEFARLAASAARGDASWGGPPNTLRHMTELADHRVRDVPSPNVDTLYSNGFLDLSGGPVEVVCPTEHGRYFSVAFLDAYTDIIAYVGTRATQGEGGRFWVAGPGWSGDPPNGVQVLRSSTTDAWVFARIEVNGPADLAAAQAVQREVRVEPVQASASRPFKLQAQLQDPVGFLGAVNEMLGRSPNVGHARRAARFASFGIGAGISPSHDQIAAWRPFLAHAPALLDAAFLQDVQIVNGWRIPRRQDLFGRFGANDRLRAAMAFRGIGINVVEEAIYMGPAQDGSGEPLSGQRAYRWRLPLGGVPAEAFWSLSKCF
jgi:hypothetical protein